MVTKLIKSIHPSQHGATIEYWSKNSMVRMFLLLQKKLEGLTKGQSFKFSFATTGTFLNISHFLILSDLDSYVILLW